MTITIGTQLGSYEIPALMGKGGKGEVYRARDLKLKRDVAIKVLPETFSGNAERIRRFQREAEVLAVLNHPHISRKSRPIPYNVDSKESRAERLQKKVFTLAIPSAVPVIAGLARFVPVGSSTLGRFFSGL